MSKDILSNEKSKHRYSTIALIVIISIMGVVALVDAIDGFGTKDVLAKFTMGGVIGNSSIIDDLNGTYIYTSQICTTEGNCDSSTTPNGTKFDPSKSFELQSFCDATSFTSNINPTLLNCSTGFMTDVKFNGSMWLGMCCEYKASKCSEFNVSDILSYSGLNLTAEHILSSSYQGGFYVSCCNAQGAMCYFPQMDNFTGCGNGYSEMVSHIHFDNLTSKWGVVSCLNGFN